MWSNAFTHVLLFVIVGLLVSNMLMINELRRTTPGAAAIPPVIAEIKQKLSAVENEIARDRDSAYTLNDRTEALVAAERLATRYQVLKLLELPVDAQQQLAAEKLVQDIRSNSNEHLDERQFQALT